jgi:hypothetical protein
MPEICRFYGIIIGMFYNEHLPPHFHARYGDYEIEVNINTLEIINGKIPKRAKALILEWAEEHRAELSENWELAQQMKEIKKIKPLD